MKNGIFNIVLVAFTLAFASCEHVVMMNSKVHEDGSVDKTISLMKTDSLEVVNNYFGISEQTGWDSHAEREVKDGKKTDKFNVEFKKTFASVEEMNEQLDQDLDTLFRIHSRFEKQFRWFYTYIYYSETFRPIDRLKMVEATDFFAPEDFSFINRLPGEGIAITRADSFYLQSLNEKIFDAYGGRGIFLEQFEILKEVTRRHTQGTEWVDSLQRSRDAIYYLVSEEEFDDVLQVSLLADSLHFPIEDTLKAQEDIDGMSSDLKHRMDFMGYARDGKYINSIEMPWPVVRSNADSVAGNTLYWKPLATKFAIQEYTMMAESRQFNWWAAALTAVLIGATIFLFIRKRS